MKDREKELEKNILSTASLIEPDYKGDLLTHFSPNVNRERREHILLDR